MTPHFKFAVDSLRLLAAALAACSAGAFAMAQDVALQDLSIPERAPRDVLYRLRAPFTATTRADVLDSVQAVADQSLWGEEIHKLLLPEGADLDAALEQLRADARLQYAEANSTCRGSYVPNDPNLGSQWALSQPNDADLDAPEAWEIARDAGGVIVAIIDSGMDYTHPDLAANVWTNPAEIAGNGIDDDGNGWIDDVHGIDAVDLDGDPQDGLGHGTHVAGIIGAVGDNGIGIAGICHHVQLMPLRFLNNSNWGWYSDAILCLNYAVAHGVRLSNHSWGGASFSQALLDAINLAGSSGHLLTCAAGNSSSDTDATPNYPASYDVANVLAVAATDSSDALAGFSSFGLTSVDLGAPGASILSTWPGSQYAYLDGTSMATPHVTGVAAMLFASVPGASSAAVKDRILSSVDPLPSLNGRCVTGGRLNFARAIQRTFVVDSNGGGDFTDLNDAIAHVLEGSTLVVNGAYFGVFVDKGLTIVGMPGAQLLVEPGSNGVAALLIAAPAKSRVVVAGFQILGGEEYRTEEPAAVIIESAGSVTFEECTIVGGRSVDLLDETCAGLPSGDGIAVLGPIGMLNVTRCAVNGGDGASNESDVEAWSPDGCFGGDGIVASLAQLVVLTDSSVAGGNGGNARYDCPSGVTAWPVGGDGGDGFVGSAYASNCTLAAGKGGVAIDLCGTGQGQDGADGTDVLGTVNAFGRTLSLSGFRRNGVASVSGTGFHASGQAYLVTGFGMGGPLNLHALGLLFVGLPCSVIPVATDAAGTFSISGQLPDLDAVIGLELVFQATDGGDLSAPVVAVIDP